MRCTSLRDSPRALDRVRLGKNARQGSYPSGSNGRTNGRTPAVNACMGTGEQSQSGCYRTRRTAQDRLRQALVDWFMGLCLQDFSQRRDLLPCQSQVLPNALWIVCFTRCKIDQIVDGLDSGGDPPHVPEANYISIRMGLSAHHAFSDAR
jgi:hypothetical protein